MSPSLRYAIRTLIVSALCLSLSWNGDLPAQTPDDDALLNDGLRQHVLTLNSPFANPNLISIEDERTHIAVAKLNVKFALVDVDRPVVYGSAVTMKREQIFLRTYNGSLLPSMIRVKAGQVLRIDLHNHFPKPLPRPPDAELESNPGDFNETNLHTHGLHVSPTGSSDDVYVSIGPQENHDYCFDVTKKHVAGTFWYHAHRHRSTALQLSSGMAGALIVDPGPYGGIDSIHEIAEAMKHGREKIFVFQQLQYSLRPDGLGEVTCNDVYEPLTPMKVCNQQVSDTLAVNLTNGVYAPRIEMLPGEVQRWRCIHAGITSQLNLAIERLDGKVRLDLYQIAADGLPLAESVTSKKVLLYPGYRADFLVKAPNEPGEYVLLNDTKDRTVVPFKEKGVQPASPLLARVTVKKGSNLSMQLPDPKAIGKYTLKPIADAEIVKKGVTLEFSAEDPDFFINGKAFDPSHIELSPKLGTAEQWVLRSTEDRHPFHIHVNPFEVITKDGNGNEKRIWRDTIFFAKGQPDTVIRMRFEDFSGKTVLHCHNLPHEDRGMMMAVNIQGANTSSRCDCGPKESPSVPKVCSNWQLPDSNGKMNRFEDLKGKTTIIIFFRGMSCGHCRRQLNDFSKRHGEFAKDGIQIVAICPDQVEELKEAEENLSVGKKLSFLILSDEHLNVFKEFDCHNGAALHGVFILDDRGETQWHTIGPEPYSDIDNVLMEAQRLVKR